MLGSCEGGREGEEEGGRVDVCEQTGAYLSLQQSPTLVPATAASGMAVTDATVKVVTIKAAVISLYQRRRIFPSCVSLCLGSWRCGKLACRSCSPARWLEGREREGGGREGGRKRQGAGGDC